MLSWGRHPPLSLTSFVRPTAGRRPCVAPLVWLPDPTHPLAHIHPTTAYTCTNQKPKTQNPNPETARSASFKRSYYGWNSTGGTNQGCVTALKPSGEDWKCIFAQYVAPFIKSEIFVMQNLYDSWQINNVTTPTPTPPPPLPPPLPPPPSPTLHTCVYARIAPAHITGLPCI